MGIEAKVALLPKEGFLLDVVHLTLPDPGPHEVLIRQFASGVCHSQLHTMDRPRSQPAVLGHDGVLDWNAKGAALLDSCTRR